MFIKKEILVCDKCNTYNESDAKYCKECGAYKEDSIASSTLENIIIADKFRKMKEDTKYEDMWKQNVNVFSYEAV